MIPNSAHAKLNFRLVPDQTPHEIDRLLRACIARITPPTFNVAIRMLIAAQTALIDRGHPVMGAAAAVYHKGFSAAPAILRSGGAIPVVNMLQRALDIPVVLMGFALPDSRVHTPIERLHLPNFRNGIKTSIWFQAEVAARLKSRRRSGSPLEQRVG